MVLTKERIGKEPQDIFINKLKETIII